MSRNVGFRLPMTQRPIPEERDPHDLLWQYLPRQLKWTQIRPLNISTETDMVLRNLIQEPENLQLKYPCLLTSIKIHDFRLHKKTFCECPLILVMAASKNTRVNPCCYMVHLLYLKWEIIPAVKVTLCMNTISWYLFVAVFSGISSGVHSFRMNKNLWPKPVLEVEDVPMQHM